MWTNALLRHNNNFPSSFTLEVALILHGAYCAVYNTTHNQLTSVQWSEKDNNTMLLYYSKQLLWEARAKNGARPLLLQ